MSEPRKSCPITIKSSRWRLRKKRLDFVITDKLESLDLEHWESLNKRGSVFLSPAYLQGIKKGLGDQSDFYYTLFSQKDQPVGIAVFQITHFEADELGSNLNDKSSFVSFLSKTFVNEDRRVKVLLCGNAFATGEHGYVFDEKVDMQEAMDGVCYALTEVLNQEKDRGHKISAVIIKDFYKGTYHHTVGLERCGFSDFSVDQNMILPLLPEWKSFDDYLQSMVTKFRTKANAAMKRSELLEVHECSLDELIQYKDAYYQLYENVFNKADFRLGKMTPEAFVELKSSLGDRMIIRSYRYEGKLVGFSSALVCSHAIDAHLVGIDYSVSIDLALYSRMLYDYIALGIDHRAEAIVFGRTAAEIKSTVGAIPVDLKCCVRHPGRISNWLLSCFFSYVKPGNYPIRQPWKQPVKVELDQRVGWMEQ